MDYKKSIILPEKVWSRNEILLSPSPIPKESGVYAWYFKNFPSIIPTDDCVTFSNLTLLYIGISPKSPPLNGKPPSSQRLFHRVRYHMTGNAAGSTLRLSLGCILSERLGIQLRRVGSGNRMTFADGEQKISQWLAENAFVTWVICNKPWELESELLSELSLPLNLDQNRKHNFHSDLSILRKSARERAKRLPVVQKDT
jgi:hypothetical protein